MKKSVKAALLSALVIPGAGHLYLKNHITGLVLIGAALMSLYFLVSSAMERALQVVEKIQSGEVPLDDVTIMALVSQQSTGADAGLLKFVWPVFILVWLIGVVDSFRIGRAQDRIKAAR
jgi:hypothetical protein